MWHDKLLGQQQNIIWINGNEVTYYLRLYYSGTRKLHMLYTHQIFDFQALTNLKMVQESISDCQWITKMGLRQTTR